MSRSKAQPTTTFELCSGGCGCVAKFISKVGKFQCSQSMNSCPANRVKNSQALQKCHESGIMRTDFGGKFNRGAFKGQTKETNALLKARSERAKKDFAEGKRVNPSRPHSPETKKRMSESRIALLENSQLIDWIQLSNGINVQGKWEKNVGERLLALGYSISRVRVKYDGHRHYTPDFCIDDNVFIEVKGWLSDRDKTKYRNVFKDNPDLKIYLIRDELGIGNYSKFINGEISLEQCEILKEHIGS